MAVRSRELLDEVIEKVIGKFPEKEVDNRKIMILRQNARIMDSFAEENRAKAFDIKYCKNGTFNFKLESDLISEYTKINRFYDLVRASEKIRFELIHENNLLVIFNMPGIWKEDKE